MDRAKRKLIKALAMSGAAATILPKDWTKPVIKSVLLPAHGEGGSPIPD